MLLSYKKNSVSLRWACNSKKPMVNTTGHSYSFIDYLWILIPDQMRLRSLVILLVLFVKRVLEILTDTYLSPREWNMGKQTQYPIWYAQNNLPIFMLSQLIRSIIWKSTAITTWCRLVFIAMPLCRSMIISARHLQGKEQWVELCTLSTRLAMSMKL